MPNTNELLDRSDYLNLRKSADIQFTEIDVSAAATDTLVTGVAGSVIRVLAYGLSSSAVGGFRFVASTSGDLHPAYSIHNLGVYSTGNLLGGIFDVPAGESLQGTAGAAANIRGYLVYTIIPATGEGHSVPTFLSYTAPWNLKQANFSIAAIASTTVVTGIANKKIRVIGYIISSAATNSGYFKSGSTAITGSLRLTTVVNAHFFLPGLFETAVNQNLEFENTTGGSITGYVRYLEI